ncbi:thermonuclease family protein [Methylopila henanensis]|uniref:Thermonuclease family protein n=1 Tax=Methylopila henanensis TaxID=873516 RepID=A0ABW4K9F2_9HYPH
MNASPALLAFIAAAAPFGARAADAPCRLAAPPEAVTAARALDGETLALADGREVRLAGVLAPRLPLERDGDWPAGEEARRALEAAAAGRTLVLRAADRPDRHGRLVGYLAAPDATDHAGLSARLARSGAVRVAADRAGRDCGATLAAAESVARRQRLGLWAYPYYEVRDAADAGAFADSTGRFELAEGRVASVRSAGGRTYVNFGARWRDALALTISGNALARLGGLAALRIEPGARLRVRGVVERRLGPTISITEAAQVERLANVVGR